MVIPVTETSVGKSCHSKLGKREKKHCTKMSFVLRVNFVPLKAETCVFQGNKLIFFGYFLPNTKLACQPHVDFKRCKKNWLSVADVKYQGV